MKKLLITVGIIVGILLAVMVGMNIYTSKRSLKNYDTPSSGLTIPDNKSNQQTNINTNTSSQTNTNIKNYYDFIDTNYYTFNYTEDELMKILCGGRNYTSAGYKKTTSTKDSNTRLYYLNTNYWGYYGTETISITTDTRNNKVSKLKYCFTSLNELSADVSNRLGFSYHIGGISALSVGKINQDTMTSQEKDKISSISEEILNNKGKGISLTKSENSTNVEITLTATK